ncbi:hypothetical protein KI387_030800, partial [Taxus chinensis]
MSFLFFFLLSLCIAVKIQAQYVVPNVTGYSCSNGPTPCEIYAFYKAQEPDFLSLGNISDLFGVSRLKIAKASGLPANTNFLAEGQPLFIPITCGCMGNYSQGNVSYEIKKSDTFYSVSTNYFEHLTTYQAVEVANPTLIPENLQIGVQVIFPIRCQCPSKAQISKGIQMQITYVIQNGDTLECISEKFDVTLQDLMSQN